MVGTYYAWWFLYGIAFNYLIDWFAIRREAREGYAHIGNVVIAALVTLFFVVVDHFKG